MGGNSGNWGGGESTSVDEDKYSYKYEHTPRPRALTIISTPLRHFGLILGERLVGCYIVFFFLLLLYKDDWGTNLFNWDIFKKKNYYLLKKKFSI